MSSKVADAEGIAIMGALAIGGYFLYQLLNSAPVAGAANVVGAAAAGTGNVLNNAADVVTGAFHPLDSIGNWFSSTFGSGSDWD